MWASAEQQREQNAATRKSETPGTSAAVAAEAEESTNGEGADLDLVCLFTSQ